MSGPPHHRALYRGCGEGRVTARLPLPFGLPLLLLGACTCSSTGSSTPDRPSTVHQPAPPPQSAPTPSMQPQPLAPPLDYCHACEQTAAAGALANEGIAEASGLVASRVHPGVLYVHNDSGDRARFYALDLTGADLGSYELAGGVQARDWEDIAAAPCPSGSCLYLADIGDNAEIRSSCVVHQVTEPAVLEPGKQEVASQPLRFRYPDGSHNAETLLAHPRTGELVVVTKSLSGPTGAYQFPMPLLPDTTVELVKIAELELPRGSQLLTAGDVHPGGHGVLLRSYSDVFYAPLKTHALSSALLGSWCPLPRPMELQGESIAWTAAGDGYLTVSEGALSTIHRFECGAP